jgi:hypothetical protein
MSSERIQSASRAQRKIEPHSCVGWVFLQRTIGTRSQGDPLSASDDTGISRKRAVLFQNRTALASGAA